MNQAVEGTVVEREVVADPRALEALNRSEIDTQITTAKRFPRSVTKFHAEATSLVGLSQATADECIYALPRFDRESGENKTIEGPSARFAEIVAYSWGNCRAGARVIDEAGEFVTAQGVFWDLEKNTAIGYEVKRRIVTAKGKRYSADMIGVTANAACSIALRNAILKGVPKALWSSIYESARQTIMGDFQTLGKRREVVLGNFQKFGATPDRVFEKLGVQGIADITLEHIVVLRGMLTALKDGDSTVEDMFPRVSGEGGRGAAAAFRQATGGVQHPETGSQAAEAGQGAASEAGIGVTTHPQAGGTPQLQGKEGKQSVGAVAGMPPDPLETEFDGEAKGRKAPPKKDAGTPKLRKQYLEKIAATKDGQVLDLLYDETSLYAWSADEQAELTAAYAKRDGELRAA